MNCPGCAADIPDNSDSCPRCGRKIDPAKASIQLELGGTAVQLLGWILLAIVAGLVVVPLAWVAAATNRWLCRNLRFSNGMTASFRGVGGQVVGWMILYLVVVVAFEIASLAAAKEGIGLWLLLFVGYLLAIAAIGLKLIGWFVSNVDLSSGPRLSFTGTFGGLLGWTLLVAVSYLTIIGWAWATAAICRWFARNVRGPGIEFQFHGKGHQILWRTLVYALACVLIIPIPWMALWLMRWFVRNTSITQGAPAAAAA